MRYITTRNDRESFSVQHACQDNRGADGGFYLPSPGPEFSQQEISALKDQSFSQCVAYVLNRLFQTGLTSWDVDFSVGRYPVRLNSVGHRILVAEAWHNPDWNFDRMVTGLAGFLCKDHSGITDWIRIAVRAAALFGIYGELQRSGIDAMDISVVSGDFSAPMSAWYARQWGLPIGNIICCCNENSNLWNLMCHGHLRTDVLSTLTNLPEADISIPDDLERLIFACGGVEETGKFLESCWQGIPYCPSEQMLSKLRDGLFVSVVSSQRVEKMIPGVYRTHDYVMSLGSSLAYAGLMDYRTKTGTTRPAVVFAEKSPICDADAVTAAMGISTGELNRII